MDHGSIERLSDRPDLPLEDDIYLDAFKKLGSDRPPSMGSVSRIGWKSVVSYGQYYGFTKQEIEELWYIVGKLDDVLLESTTEKTKPAKPKKGVSARGGAGDTTSQSSSPAK